MKHNRKKAIKMAIWVMVITMIVVIAGDYVMKNDMSELFDKALDYQEEKEVILEENFELLTQLKPMTFNEKVEALKAEVRNKIMKKESAGIVTEEGELFPTFDPHNAIIDKCRRIGGKMNLDCLSFGPLQFKLSTIIRYEKELNNRDITEMEALVIAHDVELASQLFDDIVYGVEGGIWNWSVAMHDKEYYTTVIPIIRKLME